MAKWSGKIGFSIEEEVRPGVWKSDSIIEKSYRGDVLRVTRRTEGNADSTNSDININAEISIVANPFAMENLYAIKYVKYLGAAWTITSVDASQYPRIVLSLGGVYNGKQA